MVFPVIAAATLCVVPPQPELVQVAVVEINTVCSPDGVLFTQVLFWADRCGGFLLDWKFFDQCLRFRAVRGSLLEPWTVSWQDKAGRHYRIRAGSILGTFTRYDPERENLAHQPVRPGIKPLPQEFVR